MADGIFPDSITLFEELIYDADPDQPLHLILNSPGGDGETAVRLARSALSRCSEFLIIVPDMAKSAATLLAMCAHRIVMGPTSDLGPIDPQFQTREGLVSAKNIIAAVEAAEAAVEARPDTFPIHASLLSNVTALMVQEARSAIERTDQIALEALGTTRPEHDAQTLWESLKGPLAEDPADHSAVFDAAAARTAGLPVVELSPTGMHWQFIWRLWVKYAVLNARVYEGARASHIIGYHPG